MMEYHSDVLKTSNNLDNIAGLVQGAIVGQADLGKVLALYSFQKKHLPRTYHQGEN